VTGATASSAAALSFVKAPASTFAALMVYVIASGEGHAAKNKVRRRD